MTPARFAALAAAYGADLGRWPTAERDAARQHLQVHANAAAILQAEAGLDAALRHWTVRGPGSALAARIAAVAPHRSAQLRRLRLWLSGLGAAAALGGGVAVGVSLAALPASPPDQELSRLYGLRVLGAPLTLDDASSGQVLDARPGQAPL